MRVARSYSLSIGTPVSVNTRPPKRNSVFASSVGSPLNGALQSEHPVPGRDLRLRVSAIERLDPDHPGRLRRVPPVRPRADVHPANRHAFAERLLADLPRDVALPGPDLDVLREIVGGHQARERPLDAGHEHVLPVRRHRGGAEDRGLADRRRDAGGRDRGQLRGEVVLEERLVVGARQQVLERRGWRGLAERSPGCAGPWARPEAQGPGRGRRR